MKRQRNTDETRIDVITIDDDSDRASEDYTYLDEEVDVDYDNADFNLLEEEQDTVVISADRFPQGRHKFLREEDIGKLQEDDIATISNLLSISKSLACFLLCQFNWSVGRLQEEWFSDEDRVREKAGLFGKPVVVHQSGYVNCRICFEDYNYSSDHSVDSAIFAASCGHLFCRDCWTGYISTSINDGPGCLMLRCPEPSCNAAVDGDLIRNVLTSNNDDNLEIERYGRYLVRSYVEKHRKMKWCPGAGCEYAVRVFDEDVTGNGTCYDVSCRCSNSFCWNCTEEIHSPVDCETVGKWTLKNKDGALNAQWIMVNTKPCPKCKTPIQKNNGCNHMTCSKACGHQFCWLCLGPRNCKCNSYIRGRGGDDMEKKRKMESESESQYQKEQLRKSLERYNHYYVRWANNEASKKKAVESLQRAQNVYIVKLASKPIPLLDKANDFSCIVDAWKQIIQCRQVIKWTYAYGYYMPEDNKYDKKRQLFEFLQHQAEQSLEKLHGCAEYEIRQFIKDMVPLEKFQDFRVKLSKLTKVTGTYFTKLVAALENGLSEVEAS